MSFIIYSMSADTFSVLQKRKESRRRNLSFHLPVAIPLAPQLRLVENDSSYVSFQDIFDKYCQAHDCAREDSMLFFTDRMRQLHDPAIQGVSFLRPHE